MFLCGFGSIIRFIYGSIGLSVVSFFSWCLHVFLVGLCFSCLFLSACCVLWCFLVGLLGVYCWFCVFCWRQKNIVQERTQLVREVPTQAPQREQECSEGPPLRREPDYRFHGRRSCGSSARETRLSPPKISCSARCR